MKDGNKYASVYKLVNLPKKRKLPSKMLVAQNQNYPLVAPKIKDKASELFAAIQSELQVFSDPDYSFTFPRSLFPDASGDSNPISYEFQKHSAVQEDTFNLKLTDQQINQIREKGEFQVKSERKNATIPYVWKLNDWLFRGRENRINIWENGLAWCYQILTEGFYYARTQVPANLKKLIYLPVQLFDLLFGLKLQKVMYIPQYATEVYKDFWTDIMQNELKDLKNEIGHQFLEKLYVKYEPAYYERLHRPEKMKNSQYEKLVQKTDQIKQMYRNQKNKRIGFKQKVIDVEKKFEENWMKIRKKVLNKVESQISSLKNPVRPSNTSEEESLKNEKMQDKKILEKFHEQKYTIYYAHLKENLPKKNVSDKIIEALVSLITIVSFIQSKVRLKNENLADIKQKIETDIDKKYRIRSKNYKYKNRLIEETYQPIAKQVQKQFYEVLLSEQLKKYFPGNYQSIYSKYIKLRNNFDKLISEKKQILKCQYEPKTTFYSNYRTIPPYKVVGEGNYRSLEKVRQISTDTGSHFWKLKLYGMRLKSWTINCAVFLIGLAWVGPTGLRCLFGIEQFVYDQDLQFSYQTDKQCHYRQTVIGRFLKGLRGIKWNRQNFESLPDRGLFGKNFSRIFNYLECYVFRLLFVEVLGVLILYPISIIVLSAIFIALAITVWIWVPLLIACYYLFNTLIFQFQSSKTQDGILIRAIPLFSLLIRILFYKFKIVFAFLYLLVIAPVFTLIYTLFLAIQRVFRAFSDRIMLLLIKTFGRTPSSNSFIASKISGPGMSQKYFYSVSQEDVYILIQSKLQRILVDKFIHLTRQQIQNHMDKYNQIMECVLSPFGYSSPQIDEERDFISENKQALLQNFNKRAKNYLKRYPKNPENVRFTREQIDRYFENSIKIVKNFIQRNKVQDWIFKENDILHEDYDQLTKSFWVKIFDCGDKIFQPLESIDSRFKLLDDTTQNNKIMRRNIESIMKVLEGEVQLSHATAEFRPAKGSLIEKDRQIRWIRTLCNYHSNNCDTDVSLDLQRPECLLVPHRNLLQIKASNSSKQKK